jgi:FKBP-type peptidyl-prolyl cis-trans isomerase
MSLKMTTMKAGNGVSPKPGDMVTVHYTGRLENGNVFDSSHKRGKPFRFQLGRGKVIRGWDMGVSKMSVGQSCRLFIPPEFAYGSGGIPGTIPQNAKLIFDIDLLKIN